jgi:hypothetical protein
MFAIIRNKDGRYVSKPGNKSSYVSGLQNARIFATRPEAQKELCIESERVIEVHLIPSGR